MIKDRIAFLQNELKDNEAALISSHANRLYYTGLSSSAGYVAVTKGGAWFLIDFRYFEKAKKTVESCEVVLLKAFTRQLGDILSSQKIKTVYLESGEQNVLLRVLSGKVKIAKVTVCQAMSGFQHWILQRTFSSQTFTSIISGPTLHMHS